MRSSSAKERAAGGGVHLTRELILLYKRALDAGDPDARSPKAEIIRMAKSG